MRIVILADEINRTPPKTQAALLEAMQERQVTVGRVRHRLFDPFFVLATQNPIEQEGTYPLPEAQQDRFMFKVYVKYPNFGEEFEIARRTTTTHQSTTSRRCCRRPEIVDLQRMVRDRAGHRPHHSLHACRWSGRRGSASRARPIRLSDQVSWAPGRGPCSS